jgi:hypothetical protein
VAHDYRKLDEQVSSYVEKHAFLLENYGEPVKPYRFYREVFPEGFLQDAYKVNPNAPHDGKFVAIANVLYEHRRGDKVYRKNQYVLDDLTQVTKWSKQVAFMAPCSFLGGAKDTEHLRFVHAFVVDLDYVDVAQLRDVIHQCQIGFLPTPTFIVNSGTGLHLYYVLEKPLACYKNKIEAYKLFKHALIDLCWNEYTSLYTERQYSGLVQSYRIPGTRSKLDIQPNTQHVVSDIFTVNAFKTGEKWTFEKLLDWKPQPPVGTMYYEERCEEIKKLLHPERDAARLTLEQAKEKYPEWYDRRILHQQPCKSIEEYKWNVSEKVYLWWLQKIRSEAKSGHRYNCIMMLAVYAIKCNIPFERLERDAYRLYDTFEHRTVDETNHFLMSDIEQALKAYKNKNYATLPIGSIEYFSDLKIPRAKRNGRKQELHIKYMNNQRAFKVEMGECTNGGRPKGSGEKKQEVYEWRQTHPDGNKSQCARDTGLSRSTVIKWWDWVPCELMSQ